MGSRTVPGSEQLRVLADAALTHVLFIQVAASCLVAHHRLIVQDLAPTTIWLMEDLSRRVGHLSTGTFLDLWWDPRSGLGESALPAVLGQADPAAQRFPDPHLLLRSPRISGSGIQYEIEGTTGNLPDRCGACILFIGHGHLAE